MPRVKCLDCPSLFWKTNAKMVRCRPCQRQIIAQQKRDDQARRRSKYQPERYDISAEEIERRYQAALIAGRRTAGRAA